MLPVVALVGRPNVGKSTLFNQLTRSRDALVADIPGLTRDRQYGMCHLLDHPFVVVDTGGLMGAEDAFTALTEKQVLAAIAEADLLVFMMDAKDGYTGTDEDVLAQLRRLHQAIIPVVNKVDGADANIALADFHATGLGQPLALATAHRRGIGDLLEVIESRLSQDDGAIEPEVQFPGTKVAVVGRPNSGKSTLINRALGEDRVMASDIPGTTRDTVRIPVTRGGVDYVLLDTAGLRRKSRVHETIEKFSVIKTLKAIEECDLVLMLVDARAGIADQDASILGHVLRSGRALVIAVNKWDGLERHERTTIMNELERKLGFLDYAKVVPISALHGSGLGKLFEQLDRVRQSSSMDLSTSQLTNVLLTATTAHPPPTKGGRAARLRYAHPGGHNPHRIIVHGNRIDHVPETYRRYLANQFRKHFDLVGCPVFVEFRRGENPYAGKKNVLSKRQLEKRRRLKRHVKGKR